MNTDQARTPMQPPALDAVDLLKADHKMVNMLFKQLDKLTQRGGSDAEKRALIGKIRDELSVHESVENEVFFPAVREVLRKKEVLQEATEDQEEAGDAIQALEDSAPGDSGYDQKLSELSGKIAAHVAEEEKDVFPKVEESNIDTQTLGKNNEPAQKRTKAEAR